MPHIIAGITHPELGRVRFLVHRLIWLLVHHEEPPRVIDHINRIPFDNRPSNLRSVSHAENMANRLVSKDSRNSGSVTKTEKGDFLVTFEDPSSPPWKLRFPERLLATSALNYLSWLHDGREVS
ncbi:HNH endonuclease signature motif containing protein [Aliiroseovarius sp. xm-a-151]|uniref:HNH endonuclease signature motif containing protein n=1 Tax=Aliiroseovarius TaxID=1658781 RepID=UPI00352F9B6D